MNFYVLEISKGLTTKIDFDDYERLKENNLLKWCAQKSSKKFYVSKTIRGKKTYLHRWILNCGDGFCVDHINGDPLDNRKQNLRICSFRENSRNVIKNSFKGVTKTRNGMYQAQIQHNGKHVTLGVFSVESEAARVYDIAAALIFGKFASFNFEFSKKFLTLLEK